MFRPPIITILGHVDHGKTTVLDYIRHSNLCDKEFGGITQRIGAYEIDTCLKGYNTSKITFIDTPGHEAFTKLRSRGASVADIALLIIDGKDSVMPQTVESISHIKAAKIPFIVVINKTDLPEANPEKVKNDLMKYEILVEGKGGNIPVVNISAKTGQGIPELLETILLISADTNLNYSPTNPVKAYIIETKRDKRGIVASAIIKDGQIKIGDTIFCNEQKIKVRSLINDLKKNINYVIPSMPFELLGFEVFPQVGQLLTNLATSKIHETAEQESTIAKVQPFNLESILHQPKEDKKLNLIIKADSQGSLEAIINSLIKKDNIDIVLKAVGSINKSDVFLAKTAKAIIVGFGTILDQDVTELAKQEKVIIKTYNIIYELVEELDEVTEILKEKQEKEKNLKGEAKILATFIIDGEKIYGIKVTKGKINLSDSLEVYRQTKLIGKTKLVSLRQRAKAVQEIKKEQEAGMVFGPPLDINVGDVVKSIL